MVEPSTQPAPAPAPDDDAFRLLVEAHERALRVHCYRMLGSLQDAEDQTQETLLRAWRNQQTFEGRASVRAWLYRIATNACLDELDRRGRRLLPPMIGAPSQTFSGLQGFGDDTPWLDPVPDAWLEVPDNSPGPRRATKPESPSSWRLSATLQRLAPRQRAVLLLRDVLGWSAREVATLLEMTVPAANSALQRARDRLDRSATPRRSRVWRLRPSARSSSVRRCLGSAATSMRSCPCSRTDAVLSMPHWPEWYVGRRCPGRVLPLGDRARRAWAVPHGANACQRQRSPSAVYAAAPGDASVQTADSAVLLADSDGIAAITSFMNPGLFRYFDLPPSL